MIHNKYVKNKIRAAYRLISGSIASYESLGAVAALVRGIDPEIDASLDRCLTAFSKLNKYQKKTAIDLSDMQALSTFEIACAQVWKQLASQLEPIATEDTKQATEARDMVYLKKLFFSSKLGLVMGILVLILIGLARFGLPMQPPAPQGDVQGTATRVIQYKNHLIPLSDLWISGDKDCMVGDAPVLHYHAIRERIKSVDGAEITDPGACGFGVVGQVTIIPHVNK